MKAIRTLLGLVLLTTLLSACGVLESLLQDIKLEDAYGLDNVLIELGVPPIGARVQQVSASYAGEFSTQFPDFDGSTLIDGIDPDTLSEVLGIIPTIEVSADATASAFPAELVLHTSRLRLSLSDRSGPTINKTFEAGDGLGITFYESGCAVGTLTTCTYTASVADVVLMTLSLAGQDLANFYTNILTDGESPNTAAGTFSLELMGSLPAGASVSVVLATKDGRLTF